MKIENLRAERGDARARVIATVAWEDCDRPAQEIFFETADEFADDLTCNPHAFLVGCLLPAMRYGERRITIEEEICPELRNGLATAMDLIHAWYGPNYKPLRIEAKIRSHLPSRRTPVRAASFLSGGIDSLATLRANRLDFPLDHPRSIKDCINVQGFDIGALQEADKELEIFERAKARLSDVAEDAKITLIPVYTTVRYLDPDLLFWEYQFHGAALASVAHVFSNRLDTVRIASSQRILNVKPWGSHPLLDPNYSSAELRILHDGLQFSRLDKVRLVADWDVALQNIRVCTENTPGVLNCGKCEKCIRTMVELLAIGKLASTGAFPANDVSRDLLGSIEIEIEPQFALYRELIEPLKAIRRLDLVEVIEAKSAQFHKHLAWEQERDWKGVVKRFDRKYLGTSLFRVYKAMRSCF